MLASPPTLHPVNSPEISRHNVQSLMIDFLYLTHLSHLMKKIFNGNDWHLFLVLVVGLTGNPLAIGSVLMVMVLHGGHVSGAHYNPAVTLAILLQKKIDTKDAGMYILFQVVGSMAAALAVFVITGNTFAPGPAATASTVSAHWLKSFFYFCTGVCDSQRSGLQSNVGQ